MSPHRKVPRWLWSKVATPKWLTIITTIGYLIALAVGGYAMSPMRRASRCAG